MVRDEVVASGITINGLPIMLKRPNSFTMDLERLDIYFEDCVIGGPGAFVIPIRDARTVQGGDSHQAGAGDRQRSGRRPRHAGAAASAADLLHPRRADVARALGQLARIPVRNRRRRRLGRAHCETQHSECARDAGSRRTRPSDQISHDRAPATAPDRTPWRSDRRFGAASRRSARRPCRLPRRERSRTRSCPSPLLPGIHCRAPERANALRRSATLSMGTSGGATIGRAAVFCVKCNSSTLRSASFLMKSSAFGRCAELGLVAQRALHQQRHLLVAQPVGPHRLDARPRPVADAVHLAALDRLARSGRCCCSRSRP